MSTVRITSRSGIPDQGNLDYSIYAPVGTAIANGTVMTIPGIGALTATFSELNGNNAIYTVEGASPTPPGWVGNFAIGASLIHSGDGSAIDQDFGPMQWVFNAGIAGFGCQIGANFYGPYTANIKAYDVSNNLLGDFDVLSVSNGNEDNSCVFLGILSNANDIRKVVMGVPLASTIHGTQDFAVNNPAMLQLAPSTGTLVFSKTTSVESPNTQFIFTVGPGLDPAVFAISGGEQVTYIDVAAGTYHCTEGTLCGWHQTGTTVSNGTIGAIVVVNGATTTADIQNAPAPVIPGQGGCGNLFLQRRLIRRVRVAPHETNLGQWIFINNVQLDLQTGIGITAGEVVGDQGVDPLIHLEISRDGGMTYGPVLTVSAGKLGEYRKRANFWRLGRGRDFVFRVTVSDPVAWSIIDAYMDAEPGIS